MLNSHIACIVKVIHIIIMLLVLIIPFTNFRKLLDMYILFIPFLFYHWIMNDDTCFLTYVERYLRGVEKEESWINEIVSPVYKIDNDTAGTMTKTITLLLYYYVLIKTNKVDIMKLITND